MATFYGTVKGNAGEVSRPGSKKSGLRVSAQSYSGSVIVEVREKDGDTWFTVEACPGSSRYGKMVFDGSINELSMKLSGKTIDELYE